MHILSHLAAATALVAAPVAASAAPVANPAASLSIAPAARASTSTHGSSRIAGGGAAGIYALAIVAGIAAIVVVAATKDDKASSR
ncbi:hypothetical protein [Sphingomonas bacterium]|uniref:hypothetical protein n=1 Tax=Sphingomonas bacterium TaxID=1895847 RepID=UPI001575F2EC|nr:hypothetical protein [Sphingomonas bacterium]